MLFTSVIFLFYFLPAFFILYYLTPVRFKNGVLLAASILFYSWGGPVFICVILLTTTIDFYLVRRMDAAEENRKFYLVLSLCINLGLLFFFKYFNFFTDNVNSALMMAGIPRLSVPEIALPLGISFYTFESVTYLVDVYRKQQKPLKNIFELQLYILYFPKLIAGPIVRFSEISQQINSRFHNETFQNRLAGLMRFIVGLAKKVLIANVLGEVADIIYTAHSQEEVSTASLWLASISYTFQIYFDFSGYSDMAIGLGMMMGFSLPENFNFPYISKSITEFWKRWHMTLGKWMKNYLYIPLGGNRVAESKVFRNLILVFLISGFWHGASWNYVLWGLFHGLLILSERRGLIRLYGRLPSLLNVLWIFFILNIGWVLFRIENTQHLFDALKNMFVWNEGKDFTSLADSKYLTILMIAILFSFGGLIKTWEIKSQDFAIRMGQSNLRTIGFTFGCLLLLLLSLSSVVANEFNPFIYFRF